MVKEPGQRSEFGGDSGNGRGAQATMAETASAAAEQMQAAATDQIEQQKQAASQSLQAFAQAVRRASDELSSQDQTMAAQVVQQAAGGLENLSRTLSSQSLGEMVGTARDFGRRNPFALAGGAALLGLALGRVARTASAGSNGAHDSQALPEQSGFPASRASGSPASATPPTQTQPRTPSQPSTAKSGSQSTAQPRPGGPAGSKSSGES